MNFRFFLVFFSGIVFAATVVFLTKTSFEKENIVRTEKASVLYKERLKICLEKDDDLLLNNLLDSFKKQPEILKISISENGRVIADTDAGEINSFIETPPVIKNTEPISKIHVIYDSFISKNKKYQIILKMSGKPSRYMEALTINISTAALIYLIICIIILVAEKGKIMPIRTVKPVFPVEECDSLSFLTGSKTAVVLVLTGENKILEASKKALEMFGSDIYGKNISDIKAFSEITNAIGKGRHPILSGGKKYFVL